MQFWKIHGAKKDFSIKSEQFVFEEVATVEEDIEAKQEYARERCKMAGGNKLGYPWILGLGWLDTLREEMLKRHCKGDTYEDPVVANLPRRYLYEKMKQLYFQLKISNSNRVF